MCTHHTLFKNAILQVLRNWVLQPKNACGVGNIHQDVDEVDKQNE